MTFNEILNEELDKKHNSLLLLDIDDSLVTARNIFIYRKLPTDKTEVKLTPEEYAKDPNSKIKSNKQYYDYRDFRDAGKVANSIKTGLPIVGNLKLMDNYIKNGWKIGILTARGMEEVISNTMKAWLKFKDHKGKLEDIGDKLIRELVFAINDDKKHYIGSTDFEKKANVMKKLIDQYDRITLVDDDLKNINAVKSMVEREKKNDPRFKKIYAKLAHKE